MTLLSVQRRSIIVIEMTLIQSKIVSMNMTSLVNLSRRRLWIISKQRWKSQRISMIKLVTVFDKQRVDERQNMSTMISISSYHQKKEAVMTRMTLTSQSFLALATRMTKTVIN